MSLTRDFHDALDRLAHAQALYTLEFILTEARRIQECACEYRYTACPHHCSCRHTCRAFTNVVESDARRIIE